jgi:hypothetical protein
MNSEQLTQWVKNIASSLCFSHTMLSPKLLQTVHQLAINTSSKLSGIKAPYDPPSVDLVTGTSIRPSEMQENIRSKLFPAFLVSVQSLAEERISEHYGDSKKISRRIEQMVAEGKVSRDLASEAHHWRLIRNVVAHGNGIISESIVSEFQVLTTKGRILFTQFEVWGPLISTGENAVAPITKEVIQDPRHPKSHANVIKITAGNSVKIGLGDILASGYTWAEFLKSMEGR